MAKTYTEKLKDPRWQKKRLEVFDAYKFTCRNCGSKEDTLHAHHHTYERGKDPWEYDLSNFVCLCEKCHKEREVYLNDIRKECSTIPNDGLRELILLMRNRGSSSYELFYALNNVITLFRPSTLEDSE